MEREPLADPSAGVRGDFRAAGPIAPRSTKYRATASRRLTAPNGWLAVRGLFWLHDGTNTAGSDPSSEIRLPPRAPKRLGVFTLKDGAVTFTAAPGSAA